MTGYKTSGWYYKPCFSAKAARRPPNPKKKKKKIAVLLLLLPNACDIVSSGVNLRSKAKDRQSN